MAKSGREKIIEAAQQLFLEGEIDMSTRGIAKKAGISTSLIFHFFKNKEDLMIEVSEKMAEFFIENLRTEQAKNVKADIKLKNMIKSHDRATNEGRFFINYLFQRSFKSEKPFMHLSYQTKKNMFDLFHKTVEEGIKEGIFQKKDAEKVTMIILRFLHSVIIKKAFHFLEGCEDKNLDADFDFLISLLKK